MIYGCRLKSRFKKSSQAGASSPAVTDTLTLQFRPRSHPRPHSPLFPSPDSTFLGWWEKEEWAGTLASISMSPFELGWGQLREGEERSLEEVEFGHTLCGDNGFASCTQFSLFNSLQLLHLEVIVQDQILVEESPSTLSPCLGGGGTKQSFLTGKSPTSSLGWKLWGLEGAGCAGSKVIADLKQWDL